MPVVGPSSVIGASATTTAPASVDWYGYAAWDGKNRVVAMANNSTTTAVSTDNGLTWGAGGTAPTTGWYGVGYIDTVFCGIIYNSRTVATSTDGTSWTQTTNALPTTRTWHRIVGGGGTFVVTTNGTQYVATSTNGTTWSEAASLPSAAQWNFIAFGNSTFVTVDSTASSTKAAYSTDGGATWGAATLPSAGSWQDVSFGGGVFVATRGASTAAAYSTDNGSTWTAATLPSSGVNPWKTAYAGNGVFLATRNSTTVGAISRDLGKTWSAYTLPASLSFDPWVNTGDGMAALARNSSTAMYFRTRKSGLQPTAQAITRAATF